MAETLTLRNEMVNGPELDATDQLSPAGIMVAAARRFSAKFDVGPAVTEQTVRALEDVASFGGAVAGGICTDSVYTGGVHVWIG